MAKVLRSPEDETPCPFPERLLRRDESLRGWEENPLFVAFVRRRAYESKLEPSFASLRVPLLLIGAALTASLFACYLIGWAGLLLLLVLPIMYFVADGVVGRKEARLPDYLHFLLSSSSSASTQPITDLWMTGNGGRAVADALYLELRATGAFLPSWFATLLATLPFGVYFWTQGILWPWDLVPLGVLMLFGLSISRWQRVNRYVGTWQQVERIAEKEWGSATTQGEGVKAHALGAAKLVFVAVLGGIALLVLGCGGLAAVFWLITAGSSHAVRLLGNHIDDLPPRIGAFFAVTALSLAAAAFFATHAWLLHRLKPGVRERVLRRAEHAWDHYVVTRVLDPSEDARRWSAERHKEWEAAAAEEKKA